MLRPLLLFFTVFLLSFISLVMIYGSVSIAMLWVVNKLGFFNIPVSIDTPVLQALFYSTIIPAIMFASIVTGMCCILVYKAVQKKHHLRIGHFVTIFRSFLLFTAFFCIGYYILVLMLVTSGKTGLLLILPYIRVMGSFFDFGLPVMWLSVAGYWILKYESKFINDEDEWMLR
jgi:hypothetical protein